MQVVRKSLFNGAQLQVVHARARPSLEKHAALERQSANVLVLPLAGVFVMHDGPRKHAIATPNHAVFVAAGKPYRMTLPTDAGDECLTLRFSAESLAHLAPEAMSGESFDLSALESCAPLDPETLLARSLLWTTFRRGAWDSLEVEEIGAGLLVSALHAARKDGRAWQVRRARSGRLLRQVGRVTEAVSAQPDRKWTLHELAALAQVSPWHLSHVFREETGAPVYRYVVRARLARALDAVFDSDMDLSTIAHENGFSSHSHFTARFRGLFGMTPLEARRRIAAGTGKDIRKIVTAGTRRPL